MAFVLELLLVNGVGDTAPTETSTLYNTPQDYDGSASVVRWATAKSNYKGYVLSGII